MTAEKTLAKTFLLVGVFYYSLPYILLNVVDCGLWPLKDAEVPSLQVRAIMQKDPQTLKLHVRFRLFYKAKKRHMLDFSSLFQNEKKPFLGLRSS